MSPDAIIFLLTNDNMSTRLSHIHRMMESSRYWTISACKVLCMSWTNKSQHGPGTLDSITLLSLKTRATSTREMWTGWLESVWPKWGAISPMETVWPTWGAISPTLCTSQSTISRMYSVTGQVVSTSSSHGIPTCIWMSPPPYMKAMATRYLSNSKC